MKYAFEILGVEKITIGVFENNSRAHACYKKVGFHDTEIVKKDPWNVVEMEILREEWKQFYYACNNNCFYFESSPNDQLFLDF